MSNRLLCLELLSEKLKSLNIKTRMAKAVFLLLKELIIPLVDDGNLCKRIFEMFPFLQIFS